LRLFTALTCIQYTGTQLRGIQKNPLSALPQWRKMLSAFGPAPLRSVVGEGSTEVPKLAPALSAEGERVGHALSRFHACLWSLLAKHGKGILEEQLQLKRVADVAIDLYGSLCVLSRASATVAGGPANTEHELALARLYLHGAMARINANLAGMQASPEANGDALTLRVAKETLAAGKYIATHPLRLPRDVSA
jgi:very long chain acyl-CoA dehydrogenase